MRTERELYLAMALPSMPMVQALRENFRGVYGKNNV
jgi:hypothetical protein